MAINRIISESSASVVGDGTSTVFSFKLSNVPESILSVVWNGYNGYATVSSYTVQNDIITVTLSAAPPAYSSYVDVWSIQVQYLY